MSEWQQDIDPPTIQRLKQGAHTLGVSVTYEQILQLTHYAELIHKWNGTYNLTALKSIEEIIHKHILDALTILVKADISGKTIVDVGSGAGIPGVVLAIMEPSSEVICVDAVKKKAAFIQHVIGQLKIGNLFSEHSRIERLPSLSADIITSRAFSSLSNFIDLTREHINCGGYWLAMKGQLSHEEQSMLPLDVEVFHVEQVELSKDVFPNMDYRHLVFIRKKELQQ